MSKITVHDIDTLLNKLSEKDRNNFFKMKSALEGEVKRRFKETWWLNLIITDTLTMQKLHASYKRMNKKQLLWHLERQMNDNVRIVWENVYLNKQVEQNAKDIQAMENALLYKERVIERYKELLTTAVEHLSV